MRRNWSSVPRSGWSTPADITPRGYPPVPARVDHDLMIFMSGETKATFIEQLRADYWGEPGGENIMVVAFGVMYIRDSLWAMP